MRSFLGSEPSKGLGSLNLTLLGRLDLTRSLIALAIIVASMGWGFVDMLGTSEIDAGGNDGVRVDDAEGILPAHIEL